jgi:hypothetical protein
MPIAKDRHLLVKWQQLQQQQLGSMIHPKMFSLQQ